MNIKPKKIKDIGALNSYVSVYRIEESTTATGQVGHAKVFLFKTWANKSNQKRKFIDLNNRETLENNTIFTMRAKEVFRKIEAFKIAIKVGNFYFYGIDYNVVNENWYTSINTTSFSNINAEE